MHLKFEAVSSQGHRYRTLDKAMLGCLGALSVSRRLEICVICVT
jgi:hypothetical protein